MTAKWPTHSAWLGFAMPESAPFRELATWTASLIFRRRHSVPLRCFRWSTLFLQRHISRAWIHTVLSFSLFVTHRKQNKKRRNVVLFLLNLICQSGILGVFFLHKDKDQKTPSVYVRRGWEKEAGSNPGRHSGNVQWTAYVLRYTPTNKIIWHPDYFPFKCKNLYEVRSFWNNCCLANELQLSYS